jgi:hypothetical protein
MPVAANPGAPACCLSCRRRFPQTTPYCSVCGQRLLPPQITEDLCVPGSGRFELLVPGVVQDGQTGLIWQQSGTPQPVAHNLAPSYLQALNSQTWGGRRDWRLPTLAELASLLTTRKTVQGLYLDAIFNSRQRYCWSATLSPAGGAYGVLFYPGSILAQPLTSAAYFRAVAGKSPLPLKEMGASRDILWQGRDLLMSGCCQRRVPAAGELEDYLRRGGYFSDVFLETGSQLYFLPTWEFLKAMVRLFRHLGVTRVVEVGAGDGLVAGALGQLGFPAVATDIDPRPNPYGVTVQAADHLEAVRRFKPQLVFWCWPPLGSEAPEDLIRCPDLRFYLEVGDGGFAAGAPGLAPRYRGRYLATLSALGYSRLDAGNFRHNRGFLFKAGTVSTAPGQ